MINTVRKENLKTTHKLFNRKLFTSNAEISEKDLKLTLNFAEKNLKKLLLYLYLFI